jgi:hypothetical protein
LGIGIGFIKKTVVLSMKYPWNRIRRLNQGNNFGTVFLGRILRVIGEVSQPQ